jgi:hypothetical protein
VGGVGFRGFVIAAFSRGLFGGCDCALCLRGNYGMWLTLNSNDEMRDKSID